MALCNYVTTYDARVTSNPVHIAINRNAAVVSKRTTAVYAEGGRSLSFKGALSGAIRRWLPRAAHPTLRKSAGTADGRLVRGHLLQAHLLQNSVPECIRKRHFHSKMKNFRGGHSPQLPPAATLWRFDPRAFGVQPLAPFQNRKYATVHQGHENRSRSSEVIVSRTHPLDLPSCQI